MSGFEKIVELTPEQRASTVVISGDVNPELAQDVADRLGVDNLSVETDQHPNGEEYVNIDGGSVSGKHVIAMQTHADGNGLETNDALVQHLLLIAAADEALAGRITAVAPNIYGARQDKRAFGKREPVTIKATMNLLAAVGADLALTVDIHSEQSLYSHPGVAKNLRALQLVLKALRGIIPDEELKEVVFATPDEGGAKTARRAARAFGARVEILEKQRGESDSQDVTHIGDELIPGLEDRTVVFVEDMIDTAGTIISAKNRVVESGAARVIAIATHAWFSDLAPERLLSSGMSDIIVTDTNPIAYQLKPKFDESKGAPNLTVVRSGGLISDALKQVVGGGDVDAIYEDPRDSKPTR